MKTTINSSDYIVISWDVPKLEPLGYNVYARTSLGFTKLNSVLVETTSYTHEVTTSNNYTYIVKAVYLYEGIQIETGGLFITESYFLPIWSKVDAGNLIIADGRDNTDTDLYTIIGPAIAKEYGEDEIAVTVDDVVYVEGTKDGDWYGAGSTITRTFSDAVRDITQIITIESRRIIISNSITYKTSINIEYEGFEITGHVAYDKLKNVFATGSGQHIISNSGIYFHNGNQTPHKVIADIDELFKYKTYANTDQEWNKLYLMDGRDYRAARILYQPNGYNSSFTISNHADGQRLNRQRAVQYGASHVDHPLYGTKGLAARGIVGDWSVFAKGSVQWVAVTEYKEFLQGLKTIGNEIVPHSIDISVDNRSDAQTYLPEYKNTFATKNWIDHSLSAGAITLGISSKGWDITDVTNYMLDLFETNGFDKAWSYEDKTHDLVTDDVWGFNHEIAYYNDHLKLPVSGNPIMLWKSSDRPFYDGWLNLQALVDNLGFVCSHDYIGANDRVTDEDTESFTLTQINIGDGSEEIGDEKSIITTGFDNICQEIAAKKTAREIWNPSLTEWLDYFAQLKQVEMDIVDDSTLSFNNTGSEISGFSILIGKKDINPKIGGVAILSKEVKNGTIVWTDLPTGESTMTY